MSKNPDPHSPNSECNSRAYKPKPEKKVLTLEYDGLFEYGAIPAELKGLNIIPLGTDKRPLEPWGEYKEKKYDKDYKITSEYAFGAICGWKVEPFGYLAVIDVDKPEIYERFKDVETFTVRTVNGGYHLYVWVRNEKPRTKPIPKHGIDIKGFGGYVVVPNSFAHNDAGELLQYKVVKSKPMSEWLSFDTYEELEEFVLSRLGVEAREGKETELGGLELSEEDINRIVELIKPYYVRGTRDLIIFYLIGMMRKAGVRLEDARKVVEAITDLMGDEEKLSRIYVLERTYGLRGTTPKLESLKGISGLRQILSKSVANEIAEIIGVSEEREEERPEKIDTLTLAHRIGDIILGAYIIKTFYTPGETEGEINCWENGVYVPCEGKIKEEILRLTPEEYRDRVSTRVEKEALFWVRRNTMEELRYEPMKLSFNNYVLDMECVIVHGKKINECITNHDPELVVFHKIPHPLPTEHLEEVEKEEFEIIAEKLAPRITKAFKDWVGHKWVLLYEILGYVFWPRYDLHKAIMLVGDGANGKSTYLKLIEKAIGPRNKASISLQDIVDYRFAPSQLYRKLANIFPDLPKTVLRETGIFKALTGEDSISAHRKFKDPINFVNYAKLLFSCNELPKVYDESYAFWRRWIVIEFPNKFTPNTGFFDTLVPEIPNAIVLGIKAFREVWKRAKFSFEETEADYRHEWKYRTNSVYAFLHDMIQEGKIIEDPDGKVETGELYSMYTQYCENNDREALDKASFTKELERHNIKRVKIKGWYYYKGIKLREENKEGLETYLT